MSYIKNRKHPVSRHAGLSVGAASLLTGLALGLPMTSAAADNAEAAELDSVKVYGARVKRYNGESTSTKYTQTLVNTTQTVNVIGNDLFTEQGATSLTEALRNSPGVGTFYAGENGNTTTGDAIYMRGFDTSGSIFVDGVRDLGAISRDVFNIDQIEITRARPAPTPAAAHPPVPSTW